MQIDKSIIEKFLADRCSAEEAKQVHRYLTDHPELLRQFYRHDWEEAGTGDPLSDGQEKRMYSAISKQINGHRTGTIRHMPWAAAAAVVVIAWCVWLYRPARQPEPTSRPIVAAMAPVQKMAVAGNWQKQKNTTRRQMKLVLPDGSAVSLSPATAIKYNTAFAPDKREIFLEGEAFFDVVKDKKRPFTVFAGSLSTTALGTSFQISASSASVNVQLFTGAVVVRSAKSFSPGWKTDVYLSPGQQVSYDVVAGIVTVSGKHTDKQAAVTPAPIQNHEHKMSFDNTPLPQVFDELAQHFKVTIDYTPEELNGLSFSGTIFYNDSIPVLLQAIARMNELSVTDIPDGFSIKKALRE